MSPLTATLPQQDRRARVDATLGMVFFVGSWSMAFGTLFLSFLVLRARAGAWPPPGVTLPSAPVATLATLVLLASSAVLHLALRRGEAGARGFAGLWAAGIGLGLAFAALQARLWAGLLAAGRPPQAGLYESLFYGLTWTHAAHVACALVALLWVQLGIHRGRYGRHLISTPGNAAIFWHFMDAVWLVLYCSFFVF